jgi:uroporphyrin-III C-methyltransferase
MRQLGVVPTYNQATVNQDIQASPLPTSAPTPTPAPSGGLLRTALPVAATALSLVAMLFAWNARNHSLAIERESIKNQSEAVAQVAEARATARAADEAARDAQSKATLLDARMADTAVQRSQLESLMLQLSKSRDENAMGEMEALLRAAAQQSQWTGRSEPLMAALKQADERLATMPSARLANVRRAVARDMQRLQASGGVDGASLALQIDELLRQVDALPLTMQAPIAVDKLAKPARTTGSPNPTVTDALPWREQVAAFWGRWTSTVADEARALVRITRIDQPQASLLPPEQAYFVRENLKLRLLSARLAVLSRQSDVALSDLRAAQTAVDVQFDAQNKRVTAASDTLKQITAAAKQVPLARPDETLTALAAFAAATSPLNK